MMNGVLVRLFATCLLVCACVSTTLAQAAKTRISVIDSDGRTAYEGPYTGVSPFGAFVNVANPDGRGVFEIDVDKNAAELSFVEVSKGDLTDLDVEYIDKYKSATQTLEEHLKLYPLRITVTTVDGKKYRDRSAYGASVHVMLSKPNGDNFKIEAKDLKKIVLTRPK